MAATTVPTRTARIQLRALRLASRTGHVRKATMALAKLFGSTQVELVLPTGAVITVGTGDAYWSRLLVGLDYEPQVKVVLDQLLRPGTYLLDCGANIGYWSSMYAPVVPVVAVEANPTVFDTLRTHSEWNGFSAVQAAVWSEAGEQVSISWTVDNEAGGSIALERGTSRSVVTTTTIECLHGQQGQGLRPVVKLDIEGAEVAALEGAGDVLDGGAVIYEDHGSDPSHKVTRWCLEHGAEVWFIDEPSHPRVTSLQQLDALKAKAHVGYNLLARFPSSLGAARRPTESA